MSVNLALTDEAHLVKEVPWTIDQTTNRLPMNKGRTPSPIGITPLSPNNNIMVKNEIVAVTNGKIQILNLAKFRITNGLSSLSSSSKVIHFLTVELLLANALIPYPIDKLVNAIAEILVNESALEVMYSTVERMVIKNKCGIVEVDANVLAREINETLVLSYSAKRSWLELSNCLASLSMWHH